MPLEEHRLLGGHGTAALLAPDAAIEWWCTPWLDSSPALWRLLDGDGGAALWRDAKPVRTVGGPAGPCARTVVEVEGRRVSCWDGLVRVDGEPTIVRLVRALREPVELTHQLVAAVFDTEEPVGSHLLRVHSADGSNHVGGNGVVDTTITAVADRWQALTLQRSTVEPPALGE